MENGNDNENEEYRKVIQKIKIWAKSEHIEGIYKQSIPSPTRGWYRDFLINQAESSHQDKLDEAARYQLEIGADIFISLLSDTEEASKNKPLPNLKPPAFMVLFAGLTLDSEQRMTRLDYIEERYVLEAEKHGIKAANLWLFRDIVNSLGPDTYEFLRKIPFRILKVLGLAELIRRFWGGN